MTNSFKDEKWFWLKGGLYALVGSVCSAWLIIQHPDPKTLVLLILIVWSFCRAYHHAFYVTEHYVDPGFKYMGLASFWDYMVDRSLRSESSERPPRYSRDHAGRENYQIKTLMLNWIAVGILGCFLLPTAHLECMRYLGQVIGTEWYVLLQMMTIGVAASFYAALAVFASLAVWPFRYRVPVAFTLLAIFCSSQFVGLHNPGASAVIGCFMLPSAVFLFAFAVSWIARVLLGWRLVPRSSLITASDKPRTGSQWGIAYLFLLSALVAIGVSLVSAMLPKDSGIELQSAFQSFELLFGAAYLVELGVVTNAVLFIILASRLTLPGSWTLVGSLLVLLIAPIVLPILLSFVTGNFTTTTANVGASYAFQVGLVVGLAILFVSARFASVRLLDRLMLNGATINKSNGLL